MKPVFLPIIWVETVIMTRLFTFCIVAAILFGGIAGEMPLVPALGALALAAGSFAFEYWDFLSKRFPESAEASCLLEAAAICLGLGATNLANQLGFMAAIPFLLRATWVKESAVRDTVALAIIVLFSGWSEKAAILPSAMTVTQALATAAIIWFAISTENPLTEGAKREASSTLALELGGQDETMRVLELREQNRKIQAQYSGLERRTAADRVKAELLDWRTGDGRHFKKLAAILQNSLNAKSITVYGIPDSKKGFLEVGSTGTVEQMPRVIDVSFLAAPIVIREHAEKAIRQLAGSESGALHTALLIHRGRIAGLVALFDEPAQISVHERTMEEVGPALAYCLIEGKEAESLLVRAQEAELIADFAQRPAGELGTAGALAVAGDLVESLGVDGCVIWDVAENPPSVMAQIGLDPLDLMSFGSMNGVAGWIRNGGHEILVEDARADERFDRSTVLRKRVGSVAILPMISSGTLSGILVVWTRASFGITAAMLRVLRATMPIALKRIFGGYATVKPGLIDPVSFWQLSRGPGSFVEIDFGTSEASRSDELRTCRRKLLAAIFTRLPEGGIISRRPTGTIIAFLPGIDEVRAGRWASALQPYMTQEFGMKTSTSVSRHSLTAPSAA